MALDPTTGSKPAPAVDPAATTVLTKPLEPPHPALQAAGFQGGIQDFNNRVQAVTDAHMAAYGTKPSPGLAFDVVRSPLAPDQFKTLFQIPQTAMQARAKAVTPTVIPPPILTSKDIFNGAIEAAKNGTYGDFVEQHGHDLQKMLQSQPKLAGRFQQALTDVRNQQHPELKGINPGRTEMGIGPAGLAGKLLFGIVMGFGQFAGATAIGPAALGYAEYKGARKSVEDKSVAPLAKTQVQLGKGIAAGVAQDVRHPVRNAPFLAADIFGALTAGAGMFSRLGRAGAALKEGAPVAAGKALVTRRVPGTVEVRRGAGVEHELVSENPLIGAIQEKVIAPARNRNIERRYTAEDTPAGVKAVLQPSRLIDAVVDRFPAESKIGRLSLARRRVEQALSDVPLRQLEHVAKATDVELTARQFVAERTGRLPDQVTTRAFLPAKLRRGLTAGEQKAIQVLATDDPDPWQAWKSFHEYMVEASVDNPAAVSAHKAQLGALKLARKAIEDPSPRLQKAMGLADELYARQQQIKVDDLGLSPVVAEQQPAKVGMVVREKKPLSETDIVDMPDGTAGVRTPGKVPYSTLERDVAQSETVLRGERRKLATLEGRLARPTKNGVKVPRPKLEERVKRQRESVAEWERQVAKDRQRREDLGPSVAPLERASDSSRYQTFERRQQTKKQVKTEQRKISANREGQFGFAPPRNDPTLTHVFTGKAILAGDFRIDSTNLAGETYARVTRLATKLREHKRLLDMGTDVPLGVDRRGNITDIPVRELDHPEIPDGLREIRGKLDTGDFLTEDDAKSVGGLEDDLINLLYPNLKWQGERIPGVKWVPPEIVGDLNQAPAVANIGVRRVQRAGQFINEGFRIPYLWLRSAYVLNNLPSNVIFNVFQQGAFTPLYLAKAMFAQHGIPGTDFNGFYGERATALLDAAHGGGKNLSFVSRDVESRALAGGRALANFWNIVADQWVRRAAVLFEAERRGYKGEDGIIRLFENPAGDAKVARDSVEVARRSKKATVEFDNLTEIERTFLRNFIFVYPWVSRSAVWSLKTMIDHPLKTDILAHIGQNEQDKFVDMLQGHLPGWFKRSGYVPVGWEGDKPKVINSSQLTAFSTLRDLETAFQSAVFQKVPNVSLADNFGPLAQLILYSTTGRDQYGNEFKGPDLVSALTLLMSQTPQASAVARGGKQSGQIPPVDIRDLNTLSKREHAALKTVALSPGWLDGYGLLITGMFTSRTADPGALAARFWREQPLDARRAHELDLIHKVLAMQSSLLAKPLPDGVKTAVDVTDAVSNDEFDQAKALGRDLTEREKDDTLLAVLTGKKLLDPEVRGRLEKQVKGLVTPDEHSRFRGTVMARYGGGGDYAKWQTDVGYFASFAHDTVEHKLAVLAQRGLINSQKAPGQGKLDEYARRFLDYKHHLEALDKAGASPTAVRAFQDQNDKPVLGMPSFPRMAWAYQTNQDQQKHLVSATTQSWQTLSALDKELLGREADSRVTAGWEKLNEVVGQEREALAREGRSFPKGYERTLAAYVEKNFNAPGLVADYDFARQPLYQRLGKLAPIAKSPNADKWKQLLSVASGYGKYLKTDGYDKAQVRQMWRDYVTEKLDPWIGEDEGFAAEVKQYGGAKFLTALLS